MIVYLSERQPHMSVHEQLIPDIDAFRDAWDSVPLRQVVFMAAVQITPDQHNEMVGYGIEGVSEPQVRVNALATRVCARYDDKHLGVFRPIVMVLPVSALAMLRASIDTTVETFTDAGKDSFIEQYSRIISACRHEAVALADHVPLPRPQE